MIAYPESGALQASDPKATHPNGTEAQSPLLRGLKPIDRALTIIENVLLAIAAVGLAITMVLIFYSALARYLFSSPVEGANIWVADFLAPMITFFALGAALRLRRHIGVTFIVRVLPGFWRLATQSLAALLTIAIFCVVGYEGAERTAHAVASNQLSSIGVPLFLAYSVVPVGSFVLVARALELCLRWWAGDRSRVYLSEIHESETQE